MLADAVTPRTAGRDAQICATSSCPDCGAQRPERCKRTAHPHVSRRHLAEAIEREAFRRRYRLPLTAPLWGPARVPPTAWHAGRAWDREEAEALRQWLRTYGPILWEARA